MHSGLDEVQKNSAHKRDNISIFGTQFRKGRHSVILMFAFFVPSFSQNQVATGLNQYPVQFQNFRWLKVIKCKNQHYCDLNVIQNSNLPQLAGTEVNSRHGCKAIFMWTSIHHHKVCKDRNKCACLICQQYLSLCVI